MWLSQYAPKGVKSLCITSSQTLYVRKPDLISCKTQARLGGRPICEIYMNTYFQRARLGGRLICEIGLYASIYGINFILHVYSELCIFCIVGKADQMKKPKPHQVWVNWGFCAVCMIWCLGHFWILSFVYFKSKRLRNSNETETDKEKKEVDWRKNKQILLLLILWCTLCTEKPDRKIPSSHCNI